VWVLLNSGSAGAYAFNHDPDTLKGAHSYRQPAQYFPNPGGDVDGGKSAGRDYVVACLYPGRRVVDGHRARRGREAAGGET